MPPVSTVTAVSANSGLERWKAVLKAQWWVFFFFRVKAEFM